MENAQLKPKQSSEGSLGSQSHLPSKDSSVVQEPNRRSSLRLDQLERQGRDPSPKRGTFLIQELSPDMEDEEEVEVEGLVIGGSLDNMNNLEGANKKWSEVMEFLQQPLEVEVMVYTSEEVREVAQKALEEDDERLGLGQQPNFDLDKIKELKETLGKAKVPTRNPYISSTTFDVQFQLEQASAGGGESAGRHTPESGEKKAKKKSFFRRILRGLHRRISFLLPSALKKNSKKIQIEKTQIEA